MERLSLDEVPSQIPSRGMQIAPLGPSPPPQSQQLPPQMFTTAAQLLDLTDKKLMVALRDGRKLIGVLRSWDQFANIVLQSTIERIFAPPAAVAGSEMGLYADVPRGMFLVRGENVLLLGEIDLDKDDDVPPGYQVSDAAVVQKILRERKIREVRKDKARVRKLAELGFEGDILGEAVI